MAERVFYDPETERTYGWRSYVREVRSRVRARYPGVPDAMIVDAVQYGLTDMQMATVRHELLRTDLAGQPMLHWFHCVRWGLRRACQYIGRELDKRGCERATDDSELERLGNERLHREQRREHVVNDPLDIVASADIYERVRAMVLPTEVEAERQTLHGASKREVAERLGISVSAVAQRRATLARRIRVLAIDAGLLERDGTYDGAPGTYD